jgi:hypothetical protein
MDKIDYTRILNEQLHLAVDWTPLTKKDLEILYDKFKDGIYTREDLNDPDVIVKALNDPRDMLFRIAQLYGSQVLDELLATLRDEGVGKGKLLQELGIGDLLKLAKTRLGKQPPEQI